MASAFHARIVTPTILIVDGDSQLSEGIRKLLGNQDIALEVASDVPAATALLTERPYCGLILNLVLNDGDGFDVLRFVIDRNLTLPTIVVGTSERASMDEDHVKFIFPSPAEPRLLAAVVRGLCGIAA
jgi:DNA-binding response OmpR family regulator